MKKKTSLTMSFALALAILPFMPKCTLNADALSGTGTKDDPFIAETYDDLKTVFGKEPTDEKDVVSYIKLGADISNDSTEEGNVLLVDSDSKLGHNLGKEKVYLDLAGHKIIRNAKTEDRHIFRVESNGILTVDDSVGGGGITSCLDSGLTTTSIFYNISGELNINAGTFETTNGGVSSEHCVFCDGGKTYINGGTFISPHTSVYQQWYGDVIINNGTFIQTADGTDENMNKGLVFYSKSGSTIYNCTAEATSGDTRLKSGEEQPLAQRFDSRSTLTVNDAVTSIDSLGQILEGKKITVSTPNVPRVDIEAARPLDHEVPNHTAVTITPNIELTTDILWCAGDVPVVDDEFFYPYLTYNAVVKLKATNDHILTKDTRVFINGVEATPLDDDFSGEVTYSAEQYVEPTKTKIRIMDITVDTPKAGETASYTINASTEGAEFIRQLPEGEYTFKKGEFNWCELNDGAYKVLDEGFTFEAGKTYYAEFVIRPLAGYSIDHNTKVTANGTEPKSVEYDAVNKTLTVYVPFEIKNEGILGDVNGDGNIDIEDAVMVINHVNGQKALTDDESKRADVDGNKDIDIEDAVAIISHVNGIKAIG